MSMGIRFVGKDPDGIAKAISVNDDGVLLVELLGSLLVGEVVENPTANTILGRMKSLESKLDTLGVAIDSILAKIIASPATEAKQAALEALVGTLTDTAVNDPTASGTIIALLKGLITQMQGDGASGKSMPVQLSGSNVAYNSVTDMNKVLVYNNWQPDTPKVIPEYSARNGQLPLDNAGDVLFITNSNRVRIHKSLDGWATDTVWYDLTPHAGKITDTNGIAISASKILIAFAHNTDPAQNGWYIVEDLGDSFRFEKVLSPVVGFSSFSFGNDKYPKDNAKIILITEYGAKTAGAYARHVHLSEDGGETWRVIFELPEELPGNTHTHSAHYDPYADRIWVVNGDEGASNLWYSDDWRRETPTWVRVWETGTAPVQFTTIYSTLDMVFFGTDGIGANGVWGLVRDPSKLKPDTTDIKPLFILDPTKSTYYVARSFKQKADGSAIYAVFSDNGIGGRKGNVIVGSVDGKRWHEIYRSRLDTNFNQMWTFEDRLIWWEGDQKAVATLTWSKL